MDTDYNVHSELTMAERNAINKRADEMGRAVNYHFTKPRLGARRGTRIRLMRAVMLSIDGTYKLAKEHKLAKKALS